MDKIQPLIVHRFWILAGAAFLLPLIGWFMGAGQLAAEIDERKQKIDAIHGKSYSGDIENDKWAAGLKEINERQKRSNERSANDLWVNQERLMVWPTQVRHLMGDVEHFGRINSDALSIYKASYDSILLGMYRVIEPTNLSQSYKGKIRVDGDIQAVPENAWDNRNPTSKEIWEAQEDVWLTTSLLRAIAEVNADAENIEQSAVRVLERLTLHGGRPRGSAAPRAGGGEGGDMYGGAMEDLSDMGGGGYGGQFGGDMGGGMTGGNRRGLQVRGAPFQPKEEFGDDSDAPAAGGGAGGVEDAMSGYGGFGGANKKARRYIEDDPAMPFKTRGFYLQVLMDHRKLPELMVRLTNSPWPVRITRVQQTIVNRDDVLSPAGQGGGRGYTGTDYSYSDEESGMSTPMMGRGGGRNLFRGALTGRTNRPTTGRGRTTGRSTPTGQDPEAIAHQLMIDNALKDPNLAQVALTGVITIYQPPKDEDALADADDAQEAAEGETAPESAIDGDEPQLDEAAPADGADSDAAAVPAEEADSDAEPASPLESAPPAATADPDDGEAPDAAPDSADNDDADRDEDAAAPPADAEAADEPSP
jgi:hypothetical protein